MHSVYFQPESSCELLVFAVECMVTPLYGDDRKALTALWIELNRYILKS
jgi:hypothetical protein